MIRINQIKIALSELESLRKNKGIEDFHGVEAEKEILQKKAARLLHLKEGDSFSLFIVKRSLDARKKDFIHYSYSVDIKLCGPDEKRLVARLKDKDIVCVDENLYHFPAVADSARTRKIAVIGSGPAGLFCSLFLTRAGLPVTLYERGASVEERTADVKHFWDTGILLPQSNVQFGEGGAGTFSDGKLNTGIKDKTGRIRKVLETFVEFGASPSILYESKPHIGTDVLIRVVRNMRNEILRLGGKVCFHSTVTRLLIREGKISGVEINGEDEEAADTVVLAPGHSARDTFLMLQDMGIPFEEKAFAVGLRVEHPQSLFDEHTYGTADRGNLPAADYKVTARSYTGHGVFSFCMCPGGYIVNASSEEGRTATNGMSYFARDGRNANSAIIVTVNPEDYHKSGPLDGMYFQRSLEEAAFRIGNGKVPVTLNEDFAAGRATTGIGSVLPQIKGGFCCADLREILPEFISESLVDGMKSFDKMIRGFNRPDAVFSGVESRTSSPIRILREENLESVGVKGLYPCGEGAGYAGGITSAAVDGIKVAETIAGLSNID